MAETLITVSSQLKLSFNVSLLLDLNFHPSTVLKLPCKPNQRSIYISILAQMMVRQVPLDVHTQGMMASLLFLLRI